MTAPDLYMSTETAEGRRAAIEHLVHVSAQYGHDMARLGLEAPDLTIEWTDKGRIKVYNRAKPRRWWRR